jgi:hypothetical protein
MEKHFASLLLRSVPLAHGHDHDQDQDHDPVLMGRVAEKQARPFHTYRCVCFVGRYQGHGPSHGFFTGQELSCDWAYRAFER